LRQKLVYVRSTTGEWESLRSKQVNPENAWLFGGMTPQQLKQSALKVTSVPDDASAGW
jgi:hypothetical protein